MKFKANIRRYWYLYVACLFLFPILSYYAVSTINLPRNEETITLFIGACKESTSKLRQKLNEVKPSYLREINIRCYTYDSPNFDVVYSSFGRNGSDIVILPESKINGDTVAYYYSPLPKSFYSDGDSYYCPTIDPQAYGKRIRKAGDDQERLLEYRDENHDEDYYIFFAKNSVHLDPKWGTSSLFLSVLEEKE